MSFASQNIYRAEIGNGEVFVVSTAGMHKDPRNCGLELLKIGSIALVSALFRSSSQAYHILPANASVFFYFFLKILTLIIFSRNSSCLRGMLRICSRCEKKHQLIFLIDGFFAQHWYMSDILSQKFPSILTLYRPLTAKGSMRHQPIQRLCMPEGHRPQ